MISKKQMQVLVVFVLLGIVILIVSVQRALNRVSLSAETTETKDTASVYSIYIPSPVELAALNRVSALWPDVFNGARPLTASKLPLFYKTLYSSPKRSELGLSPPELAIVRSWSINANTASLEALKASLLVPMDQIFSDYSERAPALPDLNPKSVDEILKRAMGRGKSPDPCSLMSQERYFRIAQAWPNLQKEASARYQRCSRDEDLLGVWFDLNELMFSHSESSPDPKLQASVARRLALIESKGTPCEAQLAQRLSQAAFLKSAH